MKKLFIALCCLSLSLNLIAMEKEMPSQEKEQQKRNFFDILENSKEFRSRFEVLQSELDTWKSFDHKIYRPDISLFDHVNFLINLGPSELEIACAVHELSIIIDKKLLTENEILFLLNILKSAYCTERKHLSRNNISNREVIILIAMLNGANNAQMKDLLKEVDFFKIYYLCQLNYSFIMKFFLPYFFSQIELSRAITDQVIFLKRLYDFVNINQINLLFGDEKLKDKYIVLYYNTRAQLYFEELIRLKNKLNLNLAMFNIRCSEDREIEIYTAVTLARFMPHWKAYFKHFSAEIDVNYMLEDIESTPYLQLLWLYDHCFIWNRSCSKRIEPLIKFFIKHGADVGDSDEDIHSVIWAYAKKDELPEISNLIIEKYKSVKDKSLDDLMRYFHFLPSKAVIGMFSKLDIDINAKYEGGETLLMRCVRAGDLLKIKPAVKLLLKLNVDLECQDQQSGSTALMIACSHGYLEIAKTLLKYCSPSHIFDVKDNFGKSAYSYAVDHPNVEFSRVIVPLMEQKRMPISKEYIDKRN